MGSYFSLMASTRSIEEDSLREQPRRLILSIDGGGIRGLLPATLLNWLEEQIEVEIRAKHPGAPEPNIRLGDCFDLMSGTSTGGIISLALRVPGEDGRPKYRTSVPLELYEQKGEIVFPRKPLGSGWFKVKFSADPLENLLQEYFEMKTLNELSKPTIIVSYDVHKEDRFLFKSEDAKKLASHRFKIKDVARATSAAPTYLPAATIRSEGNNEYTLIDGGVTANNSALIAYIEAQRLYPQDKLHLISIGCGVSPVFTLEGKKSGGKLAWAGDISSVLMNTASSSTETDVAGVTSLRGDTYTRIQFQLAEQVNGLDNATPENIKLLKGYAKREIDKAISDPTNSPLSKVREALIQYFKGRGYYVYYDLLQSIKEHLVEDSSRLNLSGHHLNERSLWEVNDFVRHKGNYQIKTLDLSNNALSSMSLQYLTSFKDTLETLNLNGIGLNEEGLRQLKTHLLSAGQTIKRLVARGNPELESIETHQLVDLLSSYCETELDSEVNYKLGLHYQQRKDFARAVSYYQANGVDDQRNQLALAQLYLMGHGTQDDPLAQGYQICETLGGRGNAEAQYILGHLFAKPDRAILTILQVKNPELDKSSYLMRAADYYKLAADQQHKSAAKALANLYYKGTIKAFIPQGSPKDERHQLQEALKYYKIAQEPGSTWIDETIDKVEKELKEILEPAI